MNPTRLVLIVAALAVNAQAALTTHELQRLGSSGTAQLQCEDPIRGGYYVSLAALLKPQAAHADDVALVAAHGIRPSKQHCSLVFQGRRLRIAHIEQGVDGSVFGDWAVVSLSGRFRGAPARLDWLPVHAIEGLTANIMKHSNGQVGTACKLEKPEGDFVDPTDRDTVLIGECDTMPGMSGAPVLARVNGAPVVVGLNIGRRLAFTPGKHQPMRTVVRLVDPTIAAAIDTALSQAAHRPLQNRD